MNHKYKFVYKSDNKQRISIKKRKYSIGIQQNGNEYFINICLSFVVMNCSLQHFPLHKYGFAGRGQRPSNTRENRLEMITVMKMIIGHYEAGTLVNETGDGQ